MLCFKTSDLEQDFESIDKRLQVLLYAVAGFIAFRFDKDFIITSLYRDDYQSTHYYGRGADGRTENLTRAEGDKVVKFVNSAFIYGKAGHLTLHDEREKQGDSWTEEHFHLQVNANAVTELRS